ncbi:hypothetical protein V6O07_01595, partial [Arthrospira platensis SPKY2]
LDFINESSFMYTNGEGVSINEGFGNSYAPDMEGILEIERENLEESAILDTAILVSGHQQAILVSQGNLSEATALSEGMFDSIFGKIKQLVTSMWKRMQDFFKSVKLYFDKVVAKEGKFAETYKDEISKISNVKVEGYDFKFDLTIADAWKKAETAILGERNKLTNVIADLGKMKVDKNNSSEANKKAAGEAMGTMKGNLLTSAQLKDNVSKDIIGSDAKGFKTAVSKAFGITPKQIEVTYSGSELLKILTGLNARLNDIDADKRETDVAYRQVLKEIDNISTQAEKAASGSGKATTDAYKSQASKIKSVCAGLASSAKDLLNFVNQIAGIKAGCYKKEASQAKVAAYKGIASMRKEGNKDDKNDKGKKVNESMSFDDIWASLAGK